MVERYSNKRVSFRFSGADLLFDLSLALFSSYDIDAGTKLLLKTMAQRIDFSRCRTILDIGCGVGVIGLSIAKRYPHIRAYLQDRDAMAAAFTRANARLNGVENCSVTADIAFLRLPENRYDIIASNIPAKAGAPVLEHIAEHMTARLSGGNESTAAAVVVDPLKKEFGAMISDKGGEIIYSESTKEYTVYFFSRPSGHTEKTPAQNSTISPKTTYAKATDAPPSLEHPAQYSLPRAYFRASISPSLHGISYTLDTVWGLKNFDTPGFLIQLYAQWAVKAEAVETLLVWNPGQGHISSISLNLWKNRLRILDLSGRDTLALAASAHNLLFKTDTEVFPAADLTETAVAAQVRQREKYERIIIPLEHIPSVTREAAIWEAAVSLLAQRGELLIIGKSSDLHPFSKGEKNFTLKFSKKHKGNRIMLFRCGGR
ncbi:MAG: class I SAM-dependent methyltransferase [Spirochaetaceae bacterium]